jgi:hypothetical protein
LQRSQCPVDYIGRATNKFGEGVLPISKALGEDDWDDWEDENRRGVRNQFRWGLQALACDADVQLTLFPDFVCKPHELASDYGHWSEAARSVFAGQFSTEQLAALGAIDARLDAMSRGGTDFKEEVWAEEALSTKSQWTELRSLAKAALACFGWPAQKPPWGRSIYVSGGPRRVI